MWGARVRDADQRRWAPRSGALVRRGVWPEGFQNLNETIVFYRSPRPIAGALWGRAPRARGAVYCITACWGSDTPHAARRIGCGPLPAAAATATATATGRSRRVHKKRTPNIMCASHKPPRYSCAAAAAALRRRRCRCAQAAATSRGLQLRGADGNDGNLGDNGDDSDVAMMAMVAIMA